FVFIPIILLLGAVGLVLSLLGRYAARAIVLDDRPVLDSFRAGWHLLRTNVAPTILYAIFLAVIGLIAGVAIGFVILFLALLMGVPIFFLLSTRGFPLLLSIVFLILFALIISLAGALLYGPILAYIETAWTLAWRYLTGDGRLTTEGRPLGPTTNGYPLIRAISVRSHN
ncbi:MAG: DUF7544 domain-containing protein, partial [Ardenticatenaceae bacterium]